VGLVLARGAPAAVLFGWGAMEPAALVQITKWSRLGAWALPPLALIAMASAVLAAQNRLGWSAAAHGLALLALLGMAQGVPGYALGTVVMGGLVVLAWVVAAALLGASGALRAKALPAGAGWVLVLTLLLSGLSRLAPVLPMWLDLALAALGAALVLFVGVWAHWGLRHAVFARIGARASG
jgi:putative peptidoglycan lipid II flippase